MFALESPHRGDSNEYTQNTIFNIRKKIILNHVRSATMDYFQGTEERVFKAALANEPLKLYCTSAAISRQARHNCTHCTLSSLLKTRLERYENSADPIQMPRMQTLISISTVCFQNFFSKIQ